MTETPASQDRIAPDRCTPPLELDPLGGWNVSLRLGELEKPLDFARLFGRVAAVEVEIGSGSGIFLAEESLARPEADFLAIESDGSNVARARDKVRRRGNVNVRLLRCDALYFLEDYPPAHSVDRYHIYFPDPWPKTKHHKRRIFQPRLLGILERTLKPGGTVFIKTDVTAYYDVIVELLAGAAFLSRTLDHRIDQEALPGDRVTNFQRKAMEAGHPIHALRYERPSPVKGGKPCHP